MNMKLKDSSLNDRVKHYKMYVAGAAIDTEEYFEVVNPYNGSLLGLAPMATQAHVKQALEAARTYLASGLCESERASVLNQWADLIDEHREEIALLLTRESGKSITNAIVEVQRAAVTCRSYAQAALELNSNANDLLSQLVKEKKGDLSQQEFVDVTFFQPVGVVTAYTPFNFPANTVVHKIASAVAAGNSIVLKPSEKTPLTALKLAELFYECDVPSGLLSVVTGHYSQLTNMFITDSNVDFFTMTGHSEVGRRLYEQFTKAHPFKKCHFELGGNAPQIVLPDFDIAQAVSLLSNAVFDHNGSRCTTPRKILLPAGAYADAFYEQVVEAAKQWKIGSPESSATHIGSLIDDNAVKSVSEKVEDALVKGATLLCGGSHNNNCYEATVLCGVTPDMNIFKEENFGPVMSLMAYDSIEEAIEIANLGNYGLQPAVMTSSPLKGWNVASKLRGGCINIGNASTAHRSDIVAFGGVAASGMGKEGSLAGVKEMCYETPYKFY